jgi:hypothetical protein
MSQPLESFNNVVQTPITSDSYKGLGSGFRDQMKLAAMLRIAGEASMDEPF